MYSQNERQLRWTLKLYWETQKEDAAHAALEQSCGAAFLLENQSRQVIENTEKVSGIGQNKAMWVGWLWDAWDAWDARVS